MSFKIKGSQEQGQENISSFFQKGIPFQTSDALEKARKGHPVGFINKYGEMKMGDGSWKYVGKQGANHPAALELKKKGHKIGSEESKDPQISNLLKVGVFMSMPGNGRSRGINTQVRSIAKDHVIVAGVVKNSDGTDKLYKVPMNRIKVHYAELAKKHGLQISGSTLQRVKTIDTSITSSDQVEYKGKVHTVRAINTEKGTAQLTSGDTVNISDLKKPNNAKLSTKRISDMLYSTGKKFSAGVDKGKDNRVNLLTSSDVKSYIEKRLPVKVKNVVVASDKASKHFSSDNGLRKRVFEITLMNGQEFKLQREYGSPNWKGNVSDIERIEIV